MAFNDDVMDIEALHEFFWKYSNSKGKVNFTITEMAELFGLGYVSMSRLLGKMVAAKRLTKVRPQARSFYCVNPFEYRLEHNIVDPRSNT